MNDMPHAPATLRNREPIADKLALYWGSKKNKIFEIGSGTGEHGVFFGERFSQWTWVFSDREDNHPGIVAWRKHSGRSNMQGPVLFTMGKDSISESEVTGVYTANTFHIAAWDEVCAGIASVGEALLPGQFFIIYGPFNYEGQFTSESNREFDQSLKARDEKMGIRDFEEVCTVMQSAGFDLKHDHEMPAKNRLLVFEKI